MTVPQTLPHVDAVRDRLESAQLAVHLGVAPVGAGPPYVSLHPDPGSPTSSSLAGEHDQADVVVAVVCVGASAEQALWVGDTVATSLLGTEITVTGRAGWRPELDAAGPPVRRDDDVTPPLFYLSPQYRIRSSAT